MKNAAHADRTEPSREMAVVVHCERCDALPRLNVKVFERAAHAAGPIRHFSPVGPDGRPVGPSGNDFAISVLALRMIHQPHDPKRPFLHRAE
jgi:hypothetical protein